MLLNTRARLNEALALPHVIICIARHWRADSGRPRKGTSPNRVVPLSYPAYVDEMRWLFASVREEF